MSAFRIPFTKFFLATHHIQNIILSLTHNKSGFNCLKYILRHIGLLEVDEDKIRKIRPKGTQVRMLYVPREAIRP